jgi:uncharacterized membrane protein
MMKLYVLFEPVDFPLVSTQLWIGLGLIMLLGGLGLIFFIFLGGCGMDVKFTRFGCGLDVGWIFLPLAGLFLIILIFRPSLNTLGLKWFRGIEEHLNPQ